MKPTQLFYLFHVPNQTYNIHFHNMRKHVYFIYVLMLGFSACIIPLEPIKPTSLSSDILWKPVSGFSSEPLIRSIYATPTDLLVISDNQFSRFDMLMNLQEKRVLPNDRQLYGLPVLSDNTFMRVVQNTDNKQMLEFRSTRNNTEIKRVLTTDLVDTLKKEAFQIDVLARTPGCYSADGTKYLVTGVVYPLYKPTAFILDVQLNFSATGFVSILPVQRIEIPNLGTDGRVESCKFLEGSFYLATKDGGYRISLDGQVRKLFPEWVLNFFEYKGKLYATGFNAYDFYVSTDLGATWKRNSKPGDLRYVVTTGDKVFSQTVRGLPYSMADTTLAKSLDIKYNTDFTTDRDAYYDIAFFRNKYIINVGKLLYSADTVTTK